MPDILEENQSQKENDQYDSAINTFRTKVPHLRDMEQPLKTVEQEVAEGVQTKISDLFSDYEDTPEKSMVSSILGRTVTDGCISYGIEPVELIVVPREFSDDQVAAVSVRKFGSITINQLSIYPPEVMFRVNLLKRYGIEDTAKNITDMIFVTMHEIAHIGQGKFAFVEFEQSKKIEDYRSRPTEIHSDEVALQYCRNLLVMTESKEIKSGEDEILLKGLPETIREAEEHRRPRM